MSIRIAIDARPISGPPCGYTVYLCSVIQCLKKAGFEIILLSNKPVMDYYNEADGIQQDIFGSRNSLKWEQIDSPRHMRSVKPDLYFAGHNRGIPLFKSKGIRYILGLLDVIPFRFFNIYFPSRFARFLKNPLASSELISQIISTYSAHAILTISDSSKDDIQRIFRRSNVTSCLIRLQDSHVRPSSTYDKQFVYIGGADRRKKTDVLLIAFSRFLGFFSDYRLVLVGPDYSYVKPLIERLGISDNVQLTGFVDNRTKLDIIGRSVAMVYPSLYEGYGLAIAEGFQAAVPVIAGSGGSQGEIGGSGVRYIDPTRAEELVVAMKEMLDPAVRQAWIERGRKQLETLTDPSIEKSLVDYFTDQAARCGHLSQNKL